MKLNDRQTDNGKCADLGWKGELWLKILISWFIKHQDSCKLCMALFLWKSLFNMYIHTGHEGYSYKCEHMQAFNGSQIHHIATVHGGAHFPCSICDIKLSINIEMSISQLRSVYICAL